MEPGCWREGSVFSGSLVAKVLSHSAMTSGFLVSLFQTRQQRYSSDPSDCYCNGPSWGFGSSLFFAQNLEQRNICRCLFREPTRSQPREPPSNVPGMSMTSSGWEPTCWITRWHLPWSKPLTQSVVLLPL